MLRIWISNYIGRGNHNLLKFLSRAVSRATGSHSSTVCILENSNYVPMGFRTHLIADSGMTGKTWERKHNQYSVCQTVLNTRRCAFGKTVLSWAIVHTTRKCSHLVRRSVDALCHCNELAVHYSLCQTELSPMTASTQYRREKSWPTQWFCLRCFNVSWSKSFLPELSGANMDSSFHRIGSTGNCRSLWILRGPNHVIPTFSAASRPCIPKWSPPCFQAIARSSSSMHLLAIRGRSRQETTITMESSLCNLVSVALKNIKTHQESAERYGQWAYHGFRAIGPGRS